MKMTKDEAIEWVYDQDDSQEIDTEELDAAFLALYGRLPEDDESVWSLCCAATPNCGTRP